jgi:hypothetical protein
MSTTPNTVSITVTVDCREDVPPHVIDWMAANLAEHAHQEFGDGYQAGFVSPAWDGPPLSPGATTTTATPPRPRRRVRGYSRDFALNGKPGTRYLLDSVPLALWTKARAKARREGLSMRALILHLLTDWVER